MLPQTADPTPCRVVVVEQPVGLVPGAPDHLRHREGREKEVRAGADGEEEGARGGKKVGWLALSHG
jgi:hypothetical protein